jgi:NCS1 family nucleobase:cation symporter-1
VAGVERDRRGIWISFAIFWLIQVWIIINGLEGIKKLEGWSAPLLLGGGALLLGWAIRRGGGLGHILSESVRLQTRTCRSGSSSPPR